MAQGISTAIRINDGMSPALRSMNKALMIVLNSFESMQSATADPINTAAISEARTELARVETTLNDVENGARQAANAQDNFTDSVRNSDNAMGGLVRKVGKLVATYASFQALQGAANLSDQVSQTESRLKMIVDVSGGETFDELEQKIKASANRSRASYLDTADAITKLANNAGNAFNNNDEIIAFLEAINKEFVIGGADAQAASGAMLQLTQAMAAGALRGDELNSVLEGAPEIARLVERSMGWAEGSIKSYAEEGKVTAEVVKNAMLSNLGEINAKYKQMPWTWGQVFTVAKDKAIGALEPILAKINELANNKSVQNLANNVANNITYVANLTVTAFEKLASVARFVVDNWSKISPYIYGVVGALLFYMTVLGIVKGIELASAAAKIAIATATAIATAAQWFFASSTGAATTAQIGLNGALYACPLTWIVVIILAVIAAIIALIGWISKTLGVTNSVVGGIIGALSAAFAIIWNQFKAFVDLVFTIINMVVSQFVAFANFFANFLNDPVASIIHLFGDMADAILGILEGIARAIDAVFGSNLSSAVSGWRSGLDDKVNALAKEKGRGNYEEVLNKVNFTTDALGWERKDVKASFTAGAEFGDNLADKVKNFSLSGVIEGLTASDASENAIDELIPNFDQLAGNVGDINDNTKGIKDSVDISDEDLKYMRDIAEQEAINRFTTAEISVDFGGVSNNINSDIDLDGFMETFTDRIVESASVAAEGIHS